MTETQEVKVTFITTPVGANQTSKGERATVTLSHTNIRETGKATDNIDDDDA